MSELHLIRSQIEQKKGERKAIEKLIVKTEEDIKIANREIRTIDQAQLIIQTVAQQTQDEITFHISDIVSMALEAVFDDPYEFKLEFILKRGKVEAEISFLKNEVKIDPLSGSGGGAVDVAAFALRIALWTLGQPKTDNCIILDEPLKFISKDLRTRAAKIIKELSDRLGLQFIIVTHMSELTEFADKVFEVKLIDEVSRVKEIEQDVDTYEKN